MLSLSNYCALASRLGWGDMQADVAMPAIKKIVCNYICLIADCTGDSVTPEEAVSTILSWDNSDKIFDCLAEDSFNTLGSHISNLRWEIETCMRMGFSFEEARREWDV